MARVVPRPVAACGLHAPWDAREPISVHGTRRIAGRRGWQRPAGPGAHLDIAACAARSSPRSRRSSPARAPRSPPTDERVTHSGCRHRSSGDATRSASHPASGRAHVRPGDVPPLCRPTTTSTSTGRGAKQRMGKDNNAGRSPALLVRPVVSDEPDGEKKNLRTQLRAPHVGSTVTDRSTHTRDPGCDSGCRRAGAARRASRMHAVPAERRNLPAAQPSDRCSPPAGAAATHRWTRARSTRS